MRDDFSKEVKLNLALRVAFQCPNPDCRAFTSGPHFESSKAINVGVAAHICGAAPEGPRYDATQSPQHRRSIENGIWLCQSCAKLIDSDEAAFSHGLLQRWKREAEAEARLRLGKAQGTVAPVGLRFAQQEIELLVAAADRGEMRTHSADQLGKWVRAGAIDFLDQKDPAVAAGYLDAFESLRSRGLIRHDAGTLYALTGSGFRVAHELRAGRSIREGAAKVQGSQFVKFEPPLPYEPHVNVTRREWRGRGDLYRLEITDVSSAGFRATVRNKETDEIEAPEWASCSFIWRAEPPAA